MAYGPPLIVFGTISPPIGSIALLVAGHQAQVQTMHWLSDLLFTCAVGLQCLSPPVLALKLTLRVNQHNCGAYVY